MTDCSLRVLVLLLLLASSCRTPLGVRRVGGARAFRQLTTNALQHGAPSTVSVRALGRYDLLERYERDPDEALAALHARAVEQPSRDHVLALAELSYLTAREKDQKEYYLAAAAYAYAYLFDRRWRQAPNPYSPAFGLVCGLYNRSLSELLTSPHGDAVLEGGVRGLPFGRVTLEVTPPSFPWKSWGFGRFLPASDFLVRGLRGRNRQPGLGAALIAVRDVPRKERAPGDYMASRATVSATAFLRVHDPWHGLASGDLAAELELHATFDVDQVEVAGERVPLEIDFTVPVAYGLEEPLLWKIGVQGFLSGADTPLRPGTYMLTPFDPQKIPVVFVHGTFSSPVAWAEMFNELQSHREIRQRFQFWFFLYTTGNPIAYSGSLLRESLREVIGVLDPEDGNPALDEVMVIGHSQGGIVTKLQVVDSGDHFSRLISQGSLDDLDLSEETRTLLRRVFVFERLPFVTRVVFLSTPHRGSFVAEGWLGSLASSMVSLPREVVSVATEFFRKSEASVVEELGAKIPTSISNMNEDNPFLRTLLGIPIHHDVRAHSIIAVEGEGPADEGDDGVVTYRSAHIDGVDSELVVRSDHSCQWHPLTIVEVRRILLAHLDAIDARERQVAPRAQPGTK